MCGRQNPRNSWLWSNNNGRIRTIVECEEACFEFAARLFRLPRVDEVQRGAERVIATDQRERVQCRRCSEQTSKKAGISKGVSNVRAASWNSARKSASNEQWNQQRSKLKMQQGSSSLKIRKRTRAGLRLSEQRQLLRRVARAHIEQRKLAIRACVKSRNQLEDNSQELNTSEQHS